MEDKKELKVSAIKNGTVIDHIPSQNLFSVINILGLNHIEQQVTFGFNLESKKLGKKAIIKVAEIFFKDADLNKISLVAPDAKLNIIRDYSVVEKKVVSVPNEISGIAKCMNPKCITNNEPMPTLFRVIDKEKCTIKCHYCEKEQTREDIEIL